MKAMVTFKWPILAFCFGAALTLSPSCKAQSEIAPDHFDAPNVEPFERPSALAAVDTKTSVAKPVTAQNSALSSKPGESLRLASAHEPSAPSQSAVAVDKKRKAPVAKANKQ